MPVSRIVKVEVSRRGPQGAINPADQARIDAAAEIAETIQAVVQTATDAQAGAVAAAGQSATSATAAQQAASTAATQAAAAIAPAAADAIRAQVATDADRAEAGAARAEVAAVAVPAVLDRVASLDDSIAWPGDDSTHVEGINGAALVTLSNGLTRGTFIADDIQPGAVNGILPIETVESLSTLVNPDGTLHGALASDVSGWPGDWVTEDAIDQRGIVLRGYDTRDGTPYPDVPDASPAPGGAVDFVDPGFHGEAWGAVQGANGVIKFLSTAWAGEVIGFEQRGTKVLADTGSIATGILAVGGGDVGLAREQRAYQYHALDEALEYRGGVNGACAAAAAYLSIEGAALRARPTTIALAEAVGSTVAADFLPGASRRVQLISRLAAAATALEAWDKRLVVDRIKLDLLSGALTTPHLTADNHYAAVGNGLRFEAAEATGQAMLPALLVSQSIGTRTDGTSPVILAEGRLDWNHFALGFVVVTPLYPFPLVDGTLATLTRDAALMVSEIEALAMFEITAGREWYCPSIEEAILSGSTITVRFATMSELVLRDPAKHGFTLSGVTNGATISGVSVAGNYATITLSAAPAGTLTLNYAFGQTGDAGDGYAANRGSLTDSWSAESRAVPGSTLHRYARSGRVTVQ